jgi:DNA uptake protein ComE-like DNA-binding protein
LEFDLVLLEVSMLIYRVVQISVLCLSAVLFVGGCTVNRESDADQRARDEKTRDEVAKATERAKPALEEAGRKIGKAAHEAADEAQAAAEGVREGWNRGEHSLINVNEASESELTTLPGITAHAARKIIEGRPYQARHDLVAKGVLSEMSYQKIRDRITSK